MRPITILKSLTALSTSLLIVIGTFSSIKAFADETAVNGQLQTVLAGPWRSAENRARDHYRHPAATLTFFHIHDNDTVIEIIPGNGWYAEILAPLLKDHGHYFAAVNDPASAASNQRESQANRNKLSEKFKADPLHFGVAKLIEFKPLEPTLGKPNSVDAVLTFRNVHNWVKGGYAEGMFKAFFNVIKPGGVLGVVDHRANANTPLDNATGYLTEAYVIKLATAAGFRLDAKSEINANPKDTKNHPKGVWTLPPTLRLGDKDKEKYLAIGESDRFTLRFIKPKK